MGGGDMDWEGNTGSDAHSAVARRRVEGGRLGNFVNRSLMFVASRQRIGDLCVGAGQVEYAFPPSV